MTDRDTPHYDVTALQLTIYFNREGDHDHNGLIFALSKNVPILKYIRALARSGPPRNYDDRPATWYADAFARAQDLGVELPATPAQARQPHPLVRPLVLRARKGEQVTVSLKNEIRNRAIGLHLVADGYDVENNDGSDVGNNSSSLVAPGGQRTYHWRAGHEGVFPFHDGGNFDGGEDGTNVHGLFGAFIVEPEGTTWRDPVTGRSSHGDSGSDDFEQLDGLYLDVLPAGMRPDATPESDANGSLQTHVWDPPVDYVDFEKAAHREFVIFFHDEPEFLPPHTKAEPNPCDAHAEHAVCHQQGGGDHGGGHGNMLPIMPISYRAEPMINRERTLWRLLRTGHVLKRPVLNEEQHHSSWMFGDPVTPILKAYIGDPVRIRLVHAAVKETHVFHLHLYEWHAAANDRTSPRIDAISISPQTAHTIEPVWGAGNRQQVAGDVIWHCHLYPHFHEGMWGMFRTFETRQDGPDPHNDGDIEKLRLASSDPIYSNRLLGHYPDGTPIEKLLPLPGRKAPPLATPERPGFPLYIPGEVRQKSPIPPWPDRELTPEERGDYSDNGSAAPKDYREEYHPPCHVISLLARDMPADYDYRPVPTDLERLAFNQFPVPGELFTRNRFRQQQQAIYDDPKHCDHEPFLRNESREVCHDVAVAMRNIVYNSHGWHDKHGHLFYLESEGDPATRGGPLEPLFFRANHGQIVNLVLRNDLPEEVEETEFDHAFPPCNALPWEGECATHVHMVKFDPICADGASVGWNYMSGARFGRKMVYRWWADREFGTIFFHDHLFANYRQKHGLFGALLVEPAGSKFLHPIEAGRRIISGVQALIQRHPDDTSGTDPQNRKWFREFCTGISDFIPMWNRQNKPLNPPAAPGGHGDQGVMGLNYRSAPIRERPGDPAYWFSSRVHGDPDTTIFRTYANDPIWIRLVQGSHEEQHSYQIHGLRWQRFRANLDSAVRNQQTLGIAEAFTFINQVPFGPGDYLYKLSGADDLWLGCWGLIRAFPAPTGRAEEHVDLLTLDDAPCPPPEPLTKPLERRFCIVAEHRDLPYRSDILDPFGLIYRLESVSGPDGYVWPEKGGEPTWSGEPLVLWCREGERVIVELRNELPEELEPEPFAPEVPVERENRPVSSQVSIHADLVTYDVHTSDGANVGLNQPQTARRGETVRYFWDTQRFDSYSCKPNPTNGSERTGRALGPALLQDMADFRNHRHHGLIGALVILPADATPHQVSGDEATSRDGALQIWHGARVTVKRNGKDDQAAQREEHVVLLMQDGLRLFLNGNTGFPLPDPPEEEAGEAEKEDQGQKGFNYRTEPIGPIFDPRGSDYSLSKADPSTPVWHVPVNSNVRLHLLGACDKPRNYSFTVHGVAWPEQDFEPGSSTPVMLSSESGVTAGTARTFSFTPEHAGDHAYRSGVLKWAVPQGMWGILRVVSESRPGTEDRIRVEPSSF